MTDTNPDEVGPTRDDAPSPTPPPANTSGGADSSAQPSANDAVLPPPPDRVHAASTSEEVTKKPRWLIPAIALSAFVLIAGGVVAFLTLGGGSPKYAISGTFTLSDTSSIVRPSGTGGPCYGKGGYDDIQAGLGVKVTDGDGKVIATGALTDPVDIQDPDYKILHSCVFTISIPKKVAKTDFYSVEVGRRGEITKSFDEMKRNDWRVELTLG